MAWLGMMETIQNRVPTAHHPILNGLLFASEGGLMTSIASSPVTIQTSPQSVPSTPSWFGELAS